MKEGKDLREGRATELSGVQEGNQQMCLQEGSWEKEEGQEGGRGKGAESCGKVGWNIEFAKQWQRCEVLVSQEG